MSKWKDRAVSVSRDNSYDYLENTYLQVDFYLRAAWREVTFNANGRLQVHIVTYHICGVMGPIRSISMSSKN